jgi:hypothetical protein
LTGRRTARESSAESTMNSVSRLPRRPNPPPISMSFSFTLETGRPSASATAATAKVWLCVPHQISHRSPAAETEATELSGSICAW